MTLILNTVGQIRNSSLIYNKIKNEWSSENTPILPIPLQSHNIIHINRAKTKFLITGGRSDSGLQDDGYVYDWMKKTWTYVGKLIRGKVVSHNSVFYKGKHLKDDKVVYYVCVT